MTGKTSLNCGIYSITAPSGNQYIGSTKNFKQREYQHFNDLKHQRHANSALQNAYNKYENQLIFKPLLICRLEDLLFYEQLVLDNFKPEYNICPVAGNTLGIKQSEETKNKKRLKSLGRKHSAETKLKIGLAHKGRIRSPEHQAKITLAKTGKPLGPMSQETKDKIGKANKGRIFSQEIREKVRLANRKRFGLVG